MPSYNQITKIHRICSTPSIRIASADTVGPYMYQSIPSTGLQIRRSNKENLGIIIQISS